MKYTIRNENGDHIRETRSLAEGRRGNPNPIISQRAAARIENGFGVNRDRHAQKALRQEGARDRAQFRATLSPEEQLVRINERSGYSLKERLRLLTQMGNTEAVSEILAGMRSSSESEVQKLGHKLSARYAS